MKKLPFLMSIFGVMTVLVVTIACTQPKADPASVARGGTVYDKWWKVAEGGYRTYRELTSVH